jgi:hypothetical protein
MAIRFNANANANGISKQRYELGNQLQDLHIDVALFSETRLKPHERFFIPNCHMYRTVRYPGRKGGTAVAVRKGIKNDNHVTLLATIYLRANTTHVFISTTCFGCDAPSSGEAEYNTSNYKSLLNCNITYNKT